MNYFVLLLKLFALNPTSSFAKPLTVQEVLKLADKSHSVLSSEFEAQAAQAKTAEAYSPYDLQLYSQYTQFSDETPPSTGVSPIKTKGHEYQVGLKKMFSTGTQFDVNVKNTKTHIDYSTLTPPNVRATPNPAFTDKATLTIRQPIWRNFWAREVKLAIEIQNAHAQSQQLKSQLDKQITKAKAEQLYWQLVALDSQKAVLEETLKLSEKFTKSMENRRAYGKADAVDTANAHAQEVAREQQLLDVQLKAQQVRQELASLVQISDLKSLTFDDSLFDVYEEASFNQQLAIQEFKNKRIDLKILEQQLIPARLSQDLGREQYKPHVNLFATTSSSTRESTGSDAWDKISENDYPTNAYGVEFNWTIGSSQAKANKAYGHAMIKALQSQKKDAVANIAKDIELAFYQKKISQTQAKQAKKHIDLLTKKKNAEQSKVNQARSDQIAVIGYAIEVNAAKMNLIQAKHQERLADSMIKLALHSY